MLKIEHKGYTILQARNNHIMICKDNEMLMHISSDKKCNEEELKEHLNIYLLLKNSVDDFLKEVEE